MSNLKLLLVEDDLHKQERIAACLNTLDIDANIIVARSVRSAVLAIERSSYDAILLDMALPSHDPKKGVPSSASLLSGGMEVVMELSFLSRQDPVVIITQYPEIQLDDKFVIIDDAAHAITKSYDVNLRAVIFYDHDKMTWASEVAAIIGGLQ